MRIYKWAVFGVLLLVSVPTFVLAHAKMNASVPEDGATVPIGLSEIELGFSKPLRLTLVRVTRTTDHGVIPVISDLPKSFTKSAKLTVGTLPAGPYEVSWTAVADDGHVMSGSFKFSVSEAQRIQPQQ